MEIELQQVTEHVWTTTPNNNFFANVTSSVIEFTEYLVVVDTLIFPEDAARFRSQVEVQFGKPVKYLLITHYHGDHVLGIRSYKDVQVIGSEKLVQNMKSHMENVWIEKNFEDWKQREPENADKISEIEVFLPHQSFSKIYVIEDNENTLKFIHAGGHTSGSSYVYLQKEKVVVAGDLLFTKEFPYAGDKSCNPEEWIEFFKSILKSDFEHIIPGHGAVTDREEVTKHLVFFEALKLTIHNALEKYIDAEHIEVPEFYESEEWVIEETVKKWLAFYSK